MACGFEQLRLGAQGAGGDGGTRDPAIAREERLSSFNYLMGLLELPELMLPALPELAPAPMPPGPFPG
jgi:hypothetical protein